MGLGILNILTGGTRFTPSTDIPPLTDKVILVTGGNNGLGKQAIIELAAHQPALIWLCARGLSRAESAIADILAANPSATMIKPLDLDLCSFPSIQAAAHRVLAESTRLDILMLNAGIMATPSGLSASGYEVQFGTNHVGHALLAKLLLPLVLKTAASSPTADVRLIVLSSEAHRLIPKGGIVFDTLKTKQEDMYTWTRYGQSKTANILFAKEMARRYPQIKTIAVHPGAVATNLAAPFSQTSVVLRPLMALYFGLFAVGVEEGVKNQLWACVSEKAESGEYYVPVGVKSRPTKEAADGELAGRLWEWTEKELEGVN